MSEHRVRGSQGARERERGKGGGGNFGANAGQDDPSEPTLPYTEDRDTEDALLAALVTRARARAPAQARAHPHMNARARPHTVKHAARPPAYLFIDK